MDLVTRSKGVIDHIRQELDEVSVEGDPREWVDLVLLSLDGLWRSIHYTSNSLHKSSIVVFDHGSGDQKALIRTWDNVPNIATKLIEEKQSKNEQRDWPDWRAVDPNKAINHDRSKD